jgi:hypothetical protein
LRSVSQGNVQVLPDGNVYVGWGSALVISGFGHDGDLLFNASFPPGGEPYRAFRFAWKGYPQDVPAMPPSPGREMR